MSDVVQIVTIPHTGTRFIRELLEKHGFLTNVCHFHEFQEKEEKGLVVSTIRNPHNVYRTWIGQDRFNAARLDWKTSWELLNKMYKTKNNFVLIPIDIENEREKALDQLSNILKTQIKTDGIPVGSFPNCWVPYAEHDIRPIFELPVVKRFYTY